MSYLTNTLLSSCRTVPSNPRTTVNRPNRDRRSRSFAVELLEDRRVLATLMVNSAEDPGVGSDGLVTLREALAAANSDGTTDLMESASGADTIVFDPNVFALSRTIQLASGQLSINSDLSINGPGADLLDRRLSFVPLSLGPSNENLSAVPRFERKPPLCRKPSRQRMRVEFEDHLNVLTVGVCPAERKAWAAAGVRRGHVKGALTSLGVQTHFYDEETTDWVKTEP